MAQAKEPIQLDFGSEVKRQLDTFLAANPDIEAAMYAPKVEVPKFTKADIEAQAAKAATPEELLKQKALTDIERVVGKQAPTELTGEAAFSEGWRSLLRDVPKEAAEASAPAQLTRALQELPETSPLLTPAVQARQKADVAFRIARPAEIEQLSTSTREIARKAGTPSRVLGHAEWIARVKATEGSTLASKLAKVDQETLVRMAEQMIETGDKGLQTWGKTLLELPSKDPIAKRGIIFALSQQPEFRKMMDIAEKDSNGKQPEYIPESPLNKESQIEESDIEELDEGE
jgi:hypothetical protein